MEFRDIRGHVKILTGCCRGSEVLKWLLLFLERRVLREFLELLRGHLEVFPEVFRQGPG